MECAQTVMIIFVLLEATILVFVFVMACWGLLGVCMTGLIFQGRLSKFCECHGS